MRSIEERNALVVTHLGLAEKLAKRRFSTVNKTVQEAELLSAAYVGLVDAASRYDEAKVNVKAKRPFRCYATVRIIGEMNDYLRGCNWAPRNESDPKKMNSLERPLKEKGDGTHEVRLLRDMISANEPLPIDELNGDELFDKIIRSLPQREKMIFKLKFLHELTMKEVAAVVNLSESRISQILSDWTEFLRAVWDSRANELWEEMAADGGCVRPQYLR